VLFETRWLVALAALGTALFLGAVLYANRKRFPFTAFLREAALVVLAYFAYFLVRGASEGRPSEATAHALDVIDAERALRLYHEERLQQAILDHQSLVDAANWAYIWGHWPLIAIVATWLFVARRPTYYTFRNAFLISGGIGLIVFALYPVAPPRLADSGVVDTITEHSRSYRVFQPPALVNQYAAMPSLHFGWNLLIGIALFRTAPRRAVRAFAVALPVVMWLSVVLTGNHFILDTIAGGLLALLCLAFAVGLANRQGQRAPTLIARGTPPQMPVGRPIVIAHRFGNSLERLRKAIAAGASYVELDVWCTRGRLEVRHERTLGPLPIEWDRWYVRRRRKPLLLSDVLEALPPGMGVMLDLKGSDRRMASMVLEAVRHHGSANPFMVSARLWDHLGSLREHPELIRFHSVGTNGQLRRVRPLLDARARDAICLHYRLLDGPMVRELKQQVLSVATWPINDTGRLDQAMAWGVDAVITDNLDLVRHLRKEGERR
jgi:glycerophosphoryl diester phosphodiesterase/membrane-associated phospholipid phosphatase